MKKLIPLSYLPNTQDVYSSRKESKNDLIHWGWRCRQQMKLGSYMSSLLGRIIDLGMSIPSGYAITPEFGDPWADETERLWNLLASNHKAVLYEQFVIPGRSVFKAKRLKIRPSLWGQCVARAIDAYTEKKLLVSCGTLVGKVYRLRKAAMIS